MGFFLTRLYQDSSILRGAFESGSKPRLAESIQELQSQLGHKAVEEVIISYEDAEEQKKFGQQ